MKLFGLGIPKENFEHFDSSNIKGYDVKDNSISFRCLKKMDMPVNGQWQLTEDNCGYDFIVKVKDTQKAALLINSNYIPFEGKYEK